MKFCILGHYLCRPQNLILDQVLLKIPVQRLTLSSVQNPIQATEQSTKIKF